MKIGYTDGVYDLFHVGHLNMITEAKKRCDYLIVGVHADEIVREYKKRSTIIPANERVQIVAALKCVDEAVITEFRDKMKLFEIYKFNKIFIGDDWKGTERWNNFEKLLSEVNVVVEYIPYTKGISTTDLRSRILEDKY